MSLELPGPDTLSRDTARDGLTRDPSSASALVAPAQDAGVRALRDLTDTAVGRLYGPESAALAGARLDEVAHFNPDRAAALVRDTPEALAPVAGDRTVGPALAAALPARYASEGLARPPVGSEITRDGVRYEVAALERRVDASGATHLVGQSEAPAVAYADRDGGFPYTFHVRAFHPDAQFGGGFSGDNRGFTTRLDATSRVEQTLTLNTATDRITASDRSSPSHHSWLGTETANPEGGVRDYTLSNASDAVETHRFSSWVQGSNPLTPGFATPNVDVDGQFTVTEDLARGRLDIQAAFTGDNFPNTEAFVTDRAGTSVFLATGTLYGTPYTRLWGEDHDNPIMQANLSVHVNREGVFTGVTAGGRDYTVAEWNQRAVQNPQ